MPAPELVTHAIALDRQPRGESYFAYHLLSEDRGMLIGMVRRSSKLNVKLQIDLFDEGEFRIELKPGSHSGFIKDVHISRKRTAIARNYKSFEATSKFAKLLLSNPIHEENLPAITETLLKGLDAWESEANPLATYLKCLYLYARQEGYPVKEDPTLPDNLPQRC